MFGEDKGLSLCKEKSAHAFNQGSNSNPWSESPVSYPENYEMLLHTSLGQQAVRIYVLMSDNKVMQSTL
jgi:hypothetical protein